VVGRAAANEPRVGEARGVLGSISDGGMNGDAGVLVGVRRG
jgi:hypothetical protein